MNFALISPRGSASDSMSVLRKLSLTYLLCAMAFTVLLAFDRAPTLEQQTRQAAASGLESTRTYVTQPIAEMAQTGTHFIVASIFGDPARTPAKPVLAATPRPPRVAIPPVHLKAPSGPHLVTPQPAPDVAPPDIAIAEAPPTTAPAAT